MTTQALDHNATGFHSGMYIPGYADAASSAATYSLAPRQLLALPDENLTVTCLAGELWLTRDGDIEDYILGPGRSLTIRRGDQAAVQALKSSQLRLVAV